MRRLAVVLVLALFGGGVLAACGDGDDSESQDDATDEVTDDEQTDGGDGDGEDQQLADAIVLTEMDVPDGFVEQENEDDDDDFDEDEAVVDCVDPDLLEELQAIERGESGGAAESGFELDELVIGSGALVMPDEALAEEFFDLYSGDCIEDAFLESFTGESTDGPEFQVSVDPLEDLPDVGDAIEGFTVAGEASGFAITLEFVVLRTGRAMAFVFTAGLDETFPTADRDAAIEAVAERMESA